MQQAIYLLASALSERWYKIVAPNPLDTDSDYLVKRGNLFVDASRAIIAWLEHPRVRIARPELLVEGNYEEITLDEVQKACVSESGKEAIVRPIFRSIHQPMQSTDGTFFTTTLKDKFEPCRKSHLNIAACHSQWEVDVAAILDQHELVESWVRNFRLRWYIPWWDMQMGMWREYEPDFVAKLKGERKVHVVIEVKGIEDTPAKMKLDAAERFCAACTNFDAPIDIGAWSYLYLSNRPAFESDIETHFRALLNASKPNDQISEEQTGS